MPATSGEPPPADVTGRQKSRRKMQNPPRRGRLQGQLLWLCSLMSETTSKASSVVRASWTRRDAGSCRRLPTGQAMPISSSASNSQGSGRISSCSTPRQNQWFSKAKPLAEPNQRARARSSPDASQASKRRKQARDQKNRGDRLETAGRRKAFIGRWVVQEGATIALPALNQA